MAYLLSNIISDQIGTGYDLFTIDEAIGELDLDADDLLSQVDYGILQEQAELYLANLEENTEYRNEENIGMMNYILAEISARTVCNIPLRKE